MMPMRAKAIKSEAGPPVFKALPEAMKRPVPDTCEKAAY
jgi:hypothetical protein